MKSAFLFTVLVVQSLVTIAHAGDYLDPPYKNLKHPRVDDQVFKKSATPNLGSFFDLDVTKGAPAPVTKSDIVSMMAHQTPIRDQAARGTCSIFSSTAMLESMMIIRGEATQALDLSEEWMEYLVTRNSGTEGSDAATNFNTILDNGEVSETDLPYIGETWTDASSGLAATRCGSLSGEDLTKCLLGHWDPNLMDASLDQLNNHSDAIYNPTFYKVRTDAQASIAKLNVTDRNYDVDTTSQVKALLQQGIPVVVGMSFYYGAWNHRGGAQFGLTRNMDDWAKGIVFYPEIGSIDRDQSPNAPDGHSVLIVGYDDTVVLTRTVQMSDGTMQTFSHTGVYYFKNSWGTDNFGPQAMIDGKNYPGYGTITQDYANEFGEFYQLSLE